MVLIPSERSHAATIASDSAPGGAGVAPLGQPALGAELHGLDLFAAERAVADARAVDLAVVVAADDDAGRHRGVRRRIVAVRAGIAGDDRGARIMPDRARNLFLHGLHDRVEGVDHLRLVIEDRLARFSVVGRGEEVPRVIAQRRAGGDLLAVDAKLGAAVLVDEKAVAPVPVPLRDQALGTVFPILGMGLRRRRPHPALQREALDAKLRVVLHAAVGAAVDDLAAPLVGAVERRPPLALDQARPARVGVAVDHLHELGVVLLRPVAIHVEADRVAGMDAELVRISRQSHPSHRLSLLIALALSAGRAS